MARSELMEHVPPSDGMPTWLIAVLSIASTIAGWKGVRPVGRWLARKIDASYQTRLIERGDILATLRAQLQATHDEMIELRKDLGEERELRMALALDNAVLTERVEQLTRALAEDKRECQRSIRALQAEVRDLKRAQREGA